MHAGVLTSQVHSRSSWLWESFPIAASVGFSSTLIFFFFFSKPDFGPKLDENIDSAVLFV